MCADTDFKIFALKTPAPKFFRSIFFMKIFFMKAFFMKAFFMKIFFMAICFFFVNVMSSNQVYGAEPDVAAQAAILMDAKTGRILWEKNSNEPLAMA